jgi:hypothetical protein
MEWYPHPACQPRSQPLFPRNKNIILFAQHAIWKISVVTVYVPPLHLTNQLTVLFLFWPNIIPQQFLKGTKN